MEEILITKWGIFTSVPLDIAERNFTEFITVNDTAYVSLEKFLSKYVNLNVEVEKFKYMHLRNQWLLKVRVIGGNLDTMHIGYIANTMGRIKISEGELCVLWSIDNYAVSDLR